MTTEIEAPLAPEERYSPAERRQIIMFLRQLSRHTKTYGKVCPAPQDMPPFLQAIMLDGLVQINFIRNRHFMRVTDKGFAMMLNDYYAQNQNAVKESSVRKGGVNKKPDIAPPSDPPKGQGGNQ